MRLRTLGSLAIEGSSFRRPKPLLVLAYLALQGPKPTRQLVELFWSTATDGRDSLQTTIRRLNDVQAGMVASDGEYLRANVDCDVRHFEEAVRLRDYETALNHYPGAFLESLDVSLQEEIESWVYSTRERLAFQARKCHLDLAERAVGTKDWASARYHAESAYTLPHSPEWEGSDATLLTWLLEGTDSPRKHEATREFGDVEGTTTDNTSAARAVTGTARRSNLPFLASSFLGRRSELNHLASLLTDSSVRLVTVHGPGGVGKSRLVTESAHRLVTEDRFPHGVCFVPLETVPDRESAVVAVANALLLSLPAQTPAEQHVLGAIAARELLLILDNCEHIPDVSGPVAAIVRACPNVKVLTTSRRTLNLPEEHVVALRGLSTVSATGDSEALQLLAARLDQRSTTTAGAFDRTAAGVVCDLLDGNPLAIELAAASGRYLTLEALAVELGSGLDSLVNRDPTAPKRHESMTSALRVSWELLTDEQRRALASITVFRGGFDRDASAAVADVDLELLASLTDFAMISMRTSGRLELHALIHQFASGRLAEMPELDADMNERHARHYLMRVADLGHGVLGGETTEVSLTWIEIELPNIDRAWRWAVAREDHALLEGASWKLAHLAELRSRYHEVIQMLAAAVPPLERSTGANRRALGRILGCLSFLHFRVGSIEASHATGKQAVELLHPIRMPSGNWGLWSAYQGLAMTSLSLSKQDDAKRYLAGGIELAESDAAAAGTNQAHARIADIAAGISIQTLAYLALDAGDHRSALEHLERASALFEPHKAPHLSYIYWQAGRVHSELGSNEEAREWLEKGLAFARETGFRSLVGHTLNHLARVHLRLGDYVAASIYCEQALPHAIDSGDKWLHTSLLAAHGLALKALGELQAARSAFRASLEVARSFDGYGFAMEALAGLADPVYHEGRIDRSIALLVCVANSPHSPRFVAEEARDLVNQVGAALGADALAEAKALGASMSLEQAVELAFEGRIDTRGVRLGDERAGDAPSTN